ncbi:hypothetical protein JCM33374_g1979 [Metschnikowia sp. JCM 33374]|nr:hypothetical protein JCM33374_g1979 [Metschnikowia sp. JCM 33374]
MHKSPPLSLKQVGSLRRKEFKTFEDEIDLEINDVQGDGSSPGGDGPQAPTRGSPRTMPDTYWAQIQEEPNDIDEDDLFKQGYGIIIPFIDSLTGFLKGKSS